MARLDDKNIKSVKKTVSVASPTGGVNLSAYDKTAGPALLSGMTTNKAAQQAGSGKITPTSKKPNAVTVTTVRKAVEKTPTIQGGSLNGVVIMGEGKKPMSDIVKKPEEKKYTVGEALYVGKTKYPKVELMNALKKEGLLKYTGQSGHFTSDTRGLAEYVIKKYKIPVYDETLRTKAQADSIFATGKSN